MPFEQNARHNRFDRADADADGRDQLVNDGGDATLLIHESTDLGIMLDNDVTLPDPENSAKPVTKCAVGEGFHLTGCQHVGENIGPQEEDDE